MNDKHYNINNRKRELPKNFLLLCILLNIANFVALGQQDPQFSQNRFNHLTVNPGFAGSSGLINFSLLNRYQWVGFPGAPVTTVFNTDAKVHLIGKNDGVGFSIVNDVIGFEKNIEVGLNYSWRARVGNGQLGSGVSLGLLNKNLKIDLTGVEGADLANLSDGGLPQGDENGIMADFGVGLFYQHKNYELAASARHLNQPSLSVNETGSYSLRRHYYMSGSYFLQTANKRVQATPSFFFKTEGITWQADLGMTLQYDKRIWGGLGYRFGDALVILAGTELSNGIKFGYSYDISLSALSRYNAGSHEIFIAYAILLYKKRTHKYRSVRFL